MLGASSLDKLVPFYSDVLGLKVVGQAEGEFVFFDTGGTVQLALRELHGTADPGDTEIVFEVQNIHKCYEDLSRRAFRSGWLPASFLEPKPEISMRRISEILMGMFCQ